MIIYWNYTNELITCNNDKYDLSYHLKSLTIVHVQISVWFITDIILVVVVFLDEDFIELYYWWLHSIDDFK